MDTINNSSFKIYMFSETHSEETGEISKSYKDVIVSAPSCCEAVVKALKANREYTYLKHENI